MKKVLTCIFASILLVGCGSDAPTNQPQNNQNQEEQFEDAFLDINFNSFYQGIKDPLTGKEIKETITYYKDDVKNTRIKYEEERNFSRDENELALREKNKFYEDQYDIKAHKCLTIETPRQEKDCEQIDERIETTKEEIKELHKTGKENIVKFTDEEIKTLRDKKLELYRTINKIRTEAGLAPIES